MYGSSSGLGYTHPGFSSNLGVSAMFTVGACRPSAVVLWGMSFLNHVPSTLLTFRSLPASPLWLAGLYAPEFGVVNAVFPPPLWFSVCFGLVEVFTIGSTIRDLLQGNKLRQETLDAIADWEARQATNGLGATTGEELKKSPSEFSGSTALESVGDSSFSKQSFDSKSDILTMTALENALRTNPMPLLEFAALKDFSGTYSLDAHYLVEHALTVQQARTSASLPMWQIGDANGFRKNHRPRSTTAINLWLLSASTLISSLSNSQSSLSTFLPRR